MFDIAFSRCAIILANVPSNGSTAATDPAAASERVARWQALTARLNESLTGMNSVTAIIALALGVVALTYGWKFYRWIVLAGGGMLGAVSGNILAASTAEQVSNSTSYPWIMSIMGGATFGFLAIPYLRLALFFVVGALGAYGMYIASLAIAPQYSMFFTIGGFLVCGAVSLRFFQLVIVLSTSLLGACSTATGGLWFVKNYSPDTFGTALQYPIILPAAMLGIALMGVIVQMQLIPEDGIAPPGGKKHEGGNDDDD